MADEDKQDKTQQAEGPWSPRRLELPTTLPVVATVGVALVPILLSAIKIIAFAQANPLLITVITSTLNPRAIVASTLVTILPPVMLIVGARLVARFTIPRPPAHQFRFENEGRLVGQAITLTAGGFILLLGLLYSPWIWSVALLVYSLWRAYQAWHSLRSWKVAIAGFRRFYARSPLLPMLLVLVAMPYVFGRAAWLPTELITIDSQKSAVGYVLDATAPYTTIMYRDDLRVERVTTSRVTSRTPCQIRRAAVNDSPIGLMAPNPTPLCP